MSFPLAAATALLQSIAWGNTAVSPSVGVRTIVFNATDDEDAESADSTLTLDIYTPVVIDLNGASGGNNRAVTFTEGGAAVTLLDAAGAVSDDLSLLVITITGIDNGTYEILELDGVDYPLGTNVTVTDIEVGGTTFTLQVLVVSASSTQLILIATGGGDMAEADLNTLLRSAEFRSTVGGPVEGDRVFTFSPADTNGYAGTESTTTVTVEQAAVTSTAHTTAQSGNFEDTTTWTAGVVPGANDTIAVSNNHTVTQNTTQRVGHSPGVDDATPAISFGTNGKWVVKTGATLYVQGDVRLANGGTRFELQGTGKLMFDPSNAGDPTTAVYKLELANGDAMLITSSTDVNNIATVGTVAGDGSNARAIITRDGTTRGGKMNVDYCTFSRIGGATQYGIDFANVYDNDGICSVTNCVFDDTGGVSQEFASTGTDFIDFSNNTFVNSPTPSGGKTNLCNFYQYSAITTGSSTFTGNVFDKIVYLQAMQDVGIEDNLFFGDFSQGGYRPWGSFRNNLYYTESGSAKLPYTAEFDGNIIIQNGSGTNQHAVDPRYATTSCDDNLYYQPNGASYEGDIFLWQSNPASATTYYCRRNINVWNGVGSAGKFFSLLTGSNATYVLENNSGFIGHDDNVDGHEQGFVGIGESYDGHAGMISSLQGNLVLRESANPGWLLLQQNSSTTPTDVVTLADKNGVYGLSAGVGTSGGNPNPQGYSDGVMTADLFTASTPGVNDVSTDPACTDPYRNPVTWDESLGGAGTLTNALAEMSKRNQPGFNSAYTLANLRSYIVAGWQPTNADYETSGPSGGVIGAAPYLDGGGTGGSGPAAATYHDNSDLDRWAYFESSMLSYGATHGDYILANKDAASYGTPLDTGYYDYGYVGYLIAEYAAADQSTWRSRGDAWLYVYRRYISATGGAPAGYYKFTGGFRKAWEINADAVAKAALQTVANTGSYNHPATPLANTVDAVRSREVAYGIMNFCDADAVSVPRTDKAEDFMDQILTASTGHFAQWFDSPPYVPSDGESYFAPFMWALSSLACIQYLEDIGPDSRVLPWLITGANWVRTNCWSDVYTKHLYRIGNEQWTAGADLEMIVAPVYWWLWLQTGNTTYKSWGDACFNSAFRTIGNDGAYLAGGKQYTQSHRWTFNGLLYRAQGNAAWG